MLFNVGAVHHRFDTPAWQQAEDVLPRRLGHTLLFTGRHEQQVQFWTDVMGLAVSDRITGKVTFLNVGPGRPGGFFHYTADPWGSWIEWFSDIDQIREGWSPKDWDVPPHLWGPPPPPEFLDNKEPTR